MLTSTKFSPVFKAFYSACYRLDYFQQEVYYKRVLVWIRNEGNMLGLEEHKEPRRVYRTWVLSQGAKGFVQTKKSNPAPPYPCWHW